jgi:ubiquinone biosynthesis protein UbiJ
LSLAFERSSRIAAESQLAVAQAELSRLHLDVARLNGEVARLRRAMQVLVEEEAHRN